MTFSIFKKIFFVNFGFLRILALNFFSFFEHFFRKISKIANSKPEFDIILKQNDELIAKLHELQKAKLYEMHKFEQLMNMPAKNVHDYLKREFEKPSKVMSEDEKIQEIVQRERDRLKNEAARVIQKAVRVPNRF